MLGLCGIDGDIGDAGVFVDGKGLGPGGAAVGALVDAALFVGSPEIAERGDVDDVGIGGMDDDAADVVGLLEAEVRPGGAGVHRLVDAIAPRGALAIVGLAGADVEDRRIGGREGEVADGGIGLVVEDGLPGIAAVDGLEDSAGGGADVDDARIGFDDGEVVDASAHGGGADAAEFQVLENGIVRGLRRAVLVKRAMNRRALFGFMGISLNGSHSSAHGEAPGAGGLARRFLTRRTQR